MTDPTTDPTTDPGSIAELHARVRALEAWRAHHTDLLDDLLNHPPPPEPDDRTDHDGPGGDTDDDGTDPDEEPGDGFDPLDESTLDGDQLIAWVHRCVTAVIARPLRGEVTWCPLWWEHPEAVFRFEALHRAWTELAPEPGAAMSLWIRDHLDPCLRELLNPLGPFADCAHHHRSRSRPEHTPLPTLPTADPTR
jgi:hypothetical protein